MHISVLTTVHLALDGRIFYKEAISLVEAGHNVTLYAPLHSQASDVLNKYGITYVPLGSSDRRLLRPLRWLHLMCKLYQQKFDVWHFHDPELLLLVIIWRWLFARHVNLIYDVHEDVPKDILDKPWIPSVLRKPISRIVDQLERWGMAQCQLVVAATDSIGERVATSAKRFVIVRNYPIVEHLKEVQQLVDVRNDKVKVIFCGGMTEVRGIREIVQAMQQLQNEAIELILLGTLHPNSFEQEIRSLAGNNVVVLSQVPFQEVPQYLMKADIGIVCYQPIANHIEAMPNKLFEYMQAGLPVIASNFPLWSKIVQQAQCGIVIDPTDISKIATAIYQLATDKEARRNMGQAGMQAVKNKYSWQNEANLLLAAYKTLDMARQPS